MTISSKPVFFLLFVFSTTIIIAQQKVSRLQENQDKIQNWLSEYNTPAVGIGLIENGGIIDHGVYGESRKGIPAVDNSLFTIASITKTVTTMVVLKLINSGQWDLDEPLFKYWVDPDIAQDERHKLLTTRYVLAHMSGLPNWRSDLDSNKLEFLFEPGMKYSYSGEGYEYLRRALEQKFQKSLADLSDSILFDPIEMKDTRFHWNESFDSSRFAFRHDSDGVEYPSQGGITTSAASGLITSVEDLSKFGVYVINQVELNTDLYNEMISNQVNIKSNYDQGLGWQIIQNLPNNENAILHEGGEWGVSTILVLLPESRRGMVVLTNGDQGHEIYTKALQTFLDIGQDVVSILNGMSYDPEVIKKITLPVDLINDYEGSYYIESFKMSIDIIVEDSVLKLVSPYSKMVLFAETETVFFLEDDDLKIEFIKGASGSIKGIEVIYQGGDPEFSKRTK